MRIVIASDTFFPQVNGVAHEAYQSALSLQKRGHDVMVVCPKTRDNEKILSTEKFDAVLVPSVSALAYPGERTSVPFDPVIISRIKNFKPDIIHSHTPLAIGWLAFFAAKKCDSALVGTHHTFFDHYLKHIYLDYDWAKKISWKYTVAYYNKCRSVISPSASLAEGLAKHGLKLPVEVVPNMIDTDLFRVLDSEEKERIRKKRKISGQIITYMGRLSYEKSIDVALKAFALFHAQYPDSTFLIIGDGPEKNNLSALAEKLGVSEKVIFTGLLSGRDLAETLGAADLFVTASKSENMPLSVLQALSCGLPVVAVSEKGMKEIVSDGENGLLSPADDIISISQNFLEIVKDAEKKNKMSLAARSYAEKFSEKSIIDKLEKVYERAKRQT